TPTQAPAGCSHNPGGVAGWGRPTPAVKWPGAACRPRLTGRRTSVVPTAVPRFAFLAVDESLPRLGLAEPAPSPPRTMGERHGEPCPLGAEVEKGILGMVLNVFLTLSIRIQRQYDFRR